MTIEARFRLDRGDFTLDAEFETPSRGVNALLGPSGCGKTSLLRAMAGLDRAPAGFLRVGKEIWQDREAWVRPHERSLGFVFQEASLFPHLSVERNLEYGLKRVAAADRRVDFEEAVRLLGLEGFLHRRPQSLSGGERQRVAIARALLTSPRLLLMDEPMAGLDEESKREIFPYLERLHRQLEIPVFYVSHSPDEVARLADFLVLMVGGRIEASGPLADMMTRVDLPLAHRPEALSVVETVVVDHDDEFDLTLLDFPAGPLTVARAALPTGSAVRLQVLARDVSLTLERQEGTSILNIFPAEVEAVAPAGTAQMTVRLMVAGVPILSRITRRSAVALGLEPGRKVFAQIKSVALLA